MRSSGFLLAQLKYNVFFDGFDPYGLEIICFIYSVFVKNNNNQKMINLSIPVENLWIWKSRALMHFLVNFIISENKYQGHTSYIRTVYTETLLLKI